jgi:type I restriction enzyme S subunit
LDELVDIQIGKTPARAEPAFWGPGHPWLSISDMGNQLAVGSTKETITDLAVRRCGMKLAPTGTVLLSFKLSIGKVGRATRPLYTNEAIAALPLKARAPIEEQYLAWALRTIDLTQGQDRAAMGLTLNKPKLQRLGIPLPPLDDQRRIATILDQVHILQTKRDRSLRLLRDLETSAFREMLNSHQWPTRHVGEICRVSGGKRLPKGETYSDVPTPHRYIRLVDINNGTIRENDIRFLRPDIQKLIARYTVNADDIIISIAGSIGLVATVPDSLSGANLTENAAKLVPKELNAYDPTFLAMLLRQSDAQKQMTAKTGQVTISKLALFRIEQIQVALPDLEFQRKCVAMLEAVSIARSQAEDHLASLKSLLGSLQQRAFNGELTPSDARIPELA